MERLCPLVDSSRDAIRDELTLGGILRAFLPALLHLLKLGKHKRRVALAPCRLWYTGIGCRRQSFRLSALPASTLDITLLWGTDIVRAAWPRKVANG